MLTLIIMAPERDGRWSWALFPGASGLSISAGDDLGSARRAMGDPAATRIVVVVPGATVAMKRVPMPPASDRRARATLPFAFEDDVAQDVGRLHFSLGDDSSSDGRLAIAVAAEQMDFWIAGCRAADLTPDVLIPDFMALPRTTGRVATAIHDGRWLAVLPTGLGMSVEPELARRIFPAIADSPAAVDVVTDAEAMRPLRSWGELEIEPEISTARFMAAIHPQVSRSAPVNLLQGRFAKSGTFASQVAAWRRPMLLAASFSGLLLLDSTAAGWILTRQATEYFEVAEAEARAVLPGATRIVNPRAQLRAEAQRLQPEENDRFLELAAVTASAVRDTPGTSLVAISFDRERAGLALTVTSSSFESLERLGPAVTASGARFEAGEARQDGGRIEAQAVIRWP